jgi:hypothetical protein
VAGFEADTAPVLLIDEIDKADIEFPNDLLRELDQMEFFVHETSNSSVPDNAPSSSLPPITKGTAGRLSAPLLLSLHPLSRPGHHADHHGRALPWPAAAAGQPGTGSLLCHPRAAGPEKKPTTSELLDWLKLLGSEGIDSANWLPSTSRPACRHWPVPC